jgi:hypothetical protein
VSAQCGSVDDGARCVFGDGHKVDYHSDGNRQWFGAVCDVCGNEASSGRVMSEVEVCRLCYAGVEERARVREEERDVYRAALADMVAGLDGARARAIDVLGGHPALCGQCPHPPHQGPCLASVDPAGLTAATRDKVCPCGIEAAPVVHKHRPGTTAVLCGVSSCDQATTSADRKDTTCPACLRLWIDPGVVKAMAGGDSLARFGGPSPEEEGHG